MIRILLVDDHALLRTSLRSRLEDESGIDPVGEAGHAEQAVAKARALQPDVILLDLLLPRKSGYEAIPELLAVSPEARILVVSSQARPEAVRQAISAGAHGYVPKLASDTELIEAIRRVAAGERYVDPDLGASPDRAAARLDHLVLSTRLSIRRAGGSTPASLRLRRAPSAPGRGCRSSPSRTRRRGPSSRRSGRRRRPRG